MSSYRYYLWESDNTEGIHDARSGMTYFLPQDVEQLFTLRPRFWKDESEAGYLQPQDLIDSKSHTFKTKVFKHPTTCQVCNEVIWTEGRGCRVCKFGCHRKCEYKVTAACKPSVNYALPSNGDKRPQPTQIKLSSQHTDSNRNKMTAHVHAEIARQPSAGDSYIRYSFDLDVDYITERLIAVSFPAGGLEAQYRSNLRDVVRMLRSKHQDKYVVFNLSQKRHDIKQLSPQVYDLGWPDHLAPSLEKLCSICKHIETWLKADSHNVVVLHCKGGRGPIGVVVLAYMNYINITSSAETAMDRYAMKRFMEAKTESSMHPSQHRYVNYFTGLLTKSIQVNSAPLFLHHVLIHGVPNYDINGGCRPFLRVYQGMQPIFTSGVYSVPEGTSQFAITLGQALPIRGDILVKCYHKKFRATTRDVVFRCQFHTTAIMECRIVFQKSDLDDACTDARFPDFTKVEFIFSHTPDRLHGSDYVAGSNFPVDEMDDPLIRWDSYENFDKTIEGGDYTPEVIDLSVSINNNVPHSSAPDGSLYAEVQKTPSPIQHDNPFFASPSPTSPASISPRSNQLLPIIPNTLDYDAGPRSPMQTTQLAVLRAKMNAQMDPNFQRTPSPRTPTSDPPSPMQHPLSPTLVQFANGPQQPTDLSNGPRQSPETSTPLRREMNYKEKRDLDDLLRGIGEDVPAMSSPGSIGSGEAGDKRRIVEVEAQMSHLPSLESGRSPAPKVYHPQFRSTQGELENPYAEITDAVQKRDPFVNNQASLQDRPVEEKIAFSRVETVESSRLPDFNMQRTPQLHDNPTYAVTKENNQYPPAGRAHDGFENARAPVQQLNSSPYPQTSKQQDVWQPQPLRAKKEQLMFIYKEDPTSPQGPSVSPAFTGDNAPRQPPSYEPTQSPSSSTRASSEIGDDAMTWLQRQQQKLKEKRQREGAPVHPTYQTPKRELPKVPEPRQEPVPEPLIQPQVQAPREQAPREQAPTDNLTWLEEKQRKLQMKRGQMDPSSKPLFIDTSLPGPSYSSSFSPPRTDSSGVSSSSAANGPLPRPHLTNLEKSVTQQLSSSHSPKASVDPGPLTPPNTYEHDGSPLWQSNQRSLNRQTSDITYDRERPVVTQRRQDTERAPHAPTYGIGDGITTLPPAGPHSSTPKDNAGSVTHPPPTSHPGSQDSQDETLNVLRTQWVPGLSSDSGYASSLSSTVTGNEPVKSAKTTRFVGADGSETTTTTTTQTRKKILHVFPQQAGFNMKQLPLLFMQEIRKDESGGLQSRLLGLMRDKGVGGSPTLKRKPVSEPGCREPVISRGQGVLQIQGGGLLQTVQSHSSAAPHVPSPPHIPPQYTLPSESIPFKPTMSSSLKSSWSDQSIPNHSPQSSRMSRFHSTPRRQMINSPKRDPRWTGDLDTNQSPHSVTFYKSAQKQKSSKSPPTQTRSQSLPRNQTFKGSFQSDFPETNSSPMYPNQTSSPSGVTHFTPHVLSSDPDARLNRNATSFGGPRYHSLPRDGPLHSSHSRSYMHDTNSASHPKAKYNRSKTNPSEFGTSQKSWQSGFHNSLPRTARLTHDNLPDSEPNTKLTTNFPNFSCSTPRTRPARFLDPSSRFERVDPYAQGPHDDLMLQANPAPFIDDTRLVLPVPSYNWVMDRIQTLRHSSSNKLNLFSGEDSTDMDWGSSTKARLVQSKQGLTFRQSDTDVGRRPKQGFTDRVHNRPLGRFRDKSEGGSSSQSQDVWLRREDYEADQREPRALSADRVGTYSSTNHQREDLGQRSSGHPVGSHNVGTIPLQHLLPRNTNHKPTLSNAKTSSGVTPRVTEAVPVGQTTNPTGNINLMAGLEDAIRMLSEWTHLQNKDPAIATGRSSTTKHNLHVTDVHKGGDLTGPSRQTNLANGWTGTSAKYQSNALPRQQAAAQNVSGPNKAGVNDAYKVDLHIDESNIEEPLNLEGRVADRVADITSKNGSDQPMSQPPPGPRVKPGKARQVTRRTPQQSGYDSDSAIHQYYDPPSPSIQGKSPERWLHNPGGLPNHESEYWDRMEGLKMPNLKEQWSRKPEYDVGSSNESLPNGSATPRFPVGPKAYKNMMWTPLATVRPPHGPDEPYPLSPKGRDKRDILDTTGLHISPARQTSTDTASPMNVASTTTAAASSNTPTTPEVITVTQRRIVQTERVVDQNGVAAITPGPSPREAVMQQPITAKVERVSAPGTQVDGKAVQNGQYYPVEAKAERIPVTNYSIQELDGQAKPVSPRYQASVFPPSPKKEVTFQDARGGVPERPTGPQALVKETEIVPTAKKTVEVAPAWPIELEVHIKNEGMAPAISDVHFKRGAATPPNSPQQLSPGAQYQIPFVQEPPVKQEVIEREQVDPKFSHQLQNLSSQPPPPQYPTYSDRMRNRPPGPAYPTFSDRHRKAATGRVEEVPPQVANGYHTMYDNRGVVKAKRASTGSEGMLPARSAHQRKASDGSVGPAQSGRTTPSNFYLMQQPSPYSSSLSLADTSVDKVRFVKDLSAWWYKPHISRDEAITMLKDKCPGQFVVRDSNSFPGAFGLAVKVAQLPPNAPPSKKATDPASELVRHFLIEPNPRGVRLKGCANEPIFGSLSALIYQHTLTQLALPCKLQLPESDPSGVDAADSGIDPKSAHALLSQGAACNVLYLATMEMESLTGPSAIREATNRLVNLKDKPKKVVVHFKVSLKGVTLTDNQRVVFFRRHYPVQSVLYCGMDSGSRKWKRKDGSEARIFGFVSRKPGSKTDNQCHVFAEYEIEQPASAIVSFVTKVLLGSSVPNH